MWRHRYAPTCRCTAPGNFQQCCRSSCLALPCLALARRRYSLMKPRRDGARDKRNAGRSAHTACSCMIFLPRKIVECTHAVIKHRSVTLPDGWSNRPRHALAVSAFQSCSGLSRSCTLLNPLPPIRSTSHGPHRSVAIFADTFFCQKKSSSCMHQTRTGLLHCHAVRSSCRLCERVSLISHVPAMVSAPRACLSSIPGLP